MKEESVSPLKEIAENSVKREKEKVEQSVRMKCLELAISHNFIAPEKTPIEFAKELFNFVMNG